MHSTTAVASVASIVSAAAAAATAAASAAVAEHLAVARRLEILTEIEHGVPATWGNTRKHITHTKSTKKVTKHIRPIM